MSLKGKVAGRIINVSGLNAFAGRADWAHVCASKMGALGLTRALAQELAPHGILVDHIVPGAFDTTRTAAQSPAPQTATRDTPGPPRHSGRRRQDVRLPGLRRRQLHHRTDTAR